MQARSGTVQTEDATIFMDVNVNQKVGMFGIDARSLGELAALLVYDRVFHLKRCKVGVVELAIAPRRVNRQSIFGFKVLLPSNLLYFPIETLCIGSPKFCYY
jgi:hypothetical protein